MRVVDMLPANGGPGRGNTLIRDHQHFHNFFAVERVADTDAPGFTIFIARYLDITAGIDVEVGQSSFFQQMCGLQDGPAFDDPRRVEDTVMLDVEIPPRFLPGLFAYCQDRFHLIAIRFFSKLAPINFRNLAVFLVRAKGVINSAKIGKDFFDISFGHPGIDHLDGNGHAHKQLELFHGLCSRLRKCIREGLYEGITGIGSTCHYINIGTLCLDCFTCELRIRHAVDFY